MRPDASRKTAARTAAAGREGAQENGARGWRNSPPRRLTRARRRDPRYLAHLANAARTPRAIAEAAIARARGMAPWDPVVILADGEVRLRDGDAEAALDRAQMVARRRQARHLDAARYLAARAEAALGRTEAAIGALQELLVERPGHRRARRLLVQLGGRA